jgi:hypothetical protein
MVIRLGKWLERLKFVLLFLLLTCMLAQGYRYLKAWIEPQDPYREPRGQALRVFGEPEDPTSAPTFGERLKFFYWYGE